MKSFVPRVMMFMILVTIFGCADDGKFGYEGSPAWKMQSSDEEIKAYEDSFAPYDEVMVNGEVITSNASNSATMRGTISEVKYKGKLYTCRGNIDLAGNSRGTCKNKL